MPYTKVQNFLDMERFHDTLDNKIGHFGSRLHRFNSSLKTNYQFAKTNI